MEANNKAPLSNNKQNKMTKMCLTVTLTTGAVALVIILVAVATGVHYSPSESAEDIQSPIYPITPPQGKLYHINYSKVPTTRIGT